MKNIQPMLDPKNIEDDAEFTEHAFVPLNLSRLPKKIRIKVRRANGVVAVRHVGKRVELTLFSDYDLDVGDEYEQVAEIADAALCGARRLLDPRWTGQPVYTVGNGSIEVRIDHLVSGGEALAALDRAADALLERANALLVVASEGIRLKPPQYDD